MKKIGKELKENLTKSQQVNYSFQNNNLYFMPLNIVKIRKQTEVKNRLSYEFLDNSNKSKFKEVKENQQLPLVPFGWF